MKLFILIQIASLFLALLGCSTPAKRFNQTAVTFGFIGTEFESTQFTHQLYDNFSSINHKNSDQVHVYLDGDGSPWIQHRWLNEYPTSTNHLILEMMKLDDTPSLFLGRPCYHGFSQSKACHYKYWTSHRYSDEVVASLTQTLKSWLTKNPYRQIVLIGYSGGGTLAYLIAQRLEEITTIVTVAANLDVEQWSRYHGYPPLKRSLNPAEIKSRKTLKQLHLAGLKDDIVPADIIKTFASIQPNAEYIEFEDFNHKCCWLEVWPTILHKF